MIKFTSKLSAIDWEEVADVIAEAPLGRKKRDPFKLKKAFESSYLVIFVFDDNKLIGTGRALCDGEFQAVIYDIVLLPEYQGKGIGKKLVHRLCSQLPVENIILYSVPGREGFYVKCGFKKMRTAMAIFDKRKSKIESGYLE
ncbi:MAG: GNAT family N-acetyltransferase [Candidatus Hermodarchaeota archaeon]